MSNLNWSDLTAADLKNSDHLAKAFRKYLKKECHYSAEEARFAADVIENPYGKYASVEKTYECTVDICGTTYEIYDCTVQDCADKPFVFYMLVDVNTLEKKDEEWFSYFLATKKYVLKS